MRTARRCKGSYSPSASARVAETRIDRVKPFEKVTIGDSRRKLFYREEWDDISNLLQSSF